jgi:hypothetical protein
MPKIVCYSLTARAGFGMILFIVSLMFSFMAKGVLQL